MSKYVILRYFSQNIVTFFLVISDITTLILIYHDNNNNFSKYYDLICEISALFFKIVALKNHRRIHRSTIRLKPLTGGVNNIDLLVSVPPIKG